ncbi:MAG TPA: YbhB/YbcL family Raf kinase inhibitor-like protein [Polyangiaceae bacterium]
MRGWTTIVPGVVLCSLAACRSGAAPSAPAGATMAELSVTSQSFGSRAAIPVDDSCDGADRSPQLTWSAPPEKTKAFAIVVEDPDAPGGDFTHWLVYDLPATLRALPEGADIGAAGGVEGTSSFGRVGYDGPCPPRRELHLYQFRVLALDAPLGLRPGAPRDAVDTAMAHHVLATGSLQGTFSH